MRSHRFSKVRRTRRFRFSRPRPRSGSSSSSGSGSCVNMSHLSKYAKRPSPPFPANKCCGEIMPGNNGKMYISKSDKNGICKWVLVKN